MLIERNELQSLIPHQGAMCLLDAVLSWDEDSIVCRSATHGREDNPLRSDGVLDAVHAFEYGAQALAVHGGLRARSAGRCQTSGYLAALRNAKLGVTRLDDIGQALTVTATRLHAEHGNMIYEFAVRAGARFVASARAVIITAEGES